jgi:glutathionylspermidine synthase
LADADRDASRPGTYRRFIRRAQIHALLSDHLVGGEPYLAPDAVILSAADDELLRELTAVFARAFDRAARILAEDVPRLESMGFPWVGAELLQAEDPRVPLIGRFDFVRDVRGHWWLLEYNADTPSGVREAVAVEEALLTAYPGLARYSRPNAGLKPALAAAFVAATRHVPPGATLGLVTNASELEDLSQMAFTRRLLADAMAPNGITVVLGDIDNVRLGRRGLLLRGRRVDALYRYFPLETTFGTPAFAAIYDAVSSGKLLLLNGLFGLLLQHKGVMAWMWRHRHDPRYPADERAAIERHLPPTWDAAEWPGRSNAPGLLSDAEVVVKQVFGREGEEVFWGDTLSAADWAALAHRRTYVVQRRIEIRPDDAIVPSLAGAYRSSGFATVGSFAVAGSWAGYYTRFGSRITTSRAKWLATFARSATQPGG